MKEFKNAAKESKTAIWIRVEFNKNYKKTLTEEQKRFNEGLKTRENETR